MRPSIRLGRIFGIDQIRPLPEGRGSPRERVGPKLEACRLRPVSLTALEMEHCPRSRGGPQRLAFPAGVRIVDAAIHIFWEEAAGVWDTEGNELAIDQGVNGIAQITHRNRHIAPETECVEPIDPGVVARLAASGIFHVPQLWPRELIERPAFRAVCARRGWSIEDFAFAPIKTSEVTARQRGPVHTI